LNCGRGITTSPTVPIQLYSCNCKPLSLGLSEQQLTCIFSSAVLPKCWSRIHLRTITSLQVSTARRLKMKCSFCIA
jgi:hypothetical protein